MKQLTCLRCGEPMQFLTRERIQLGKTGWILGDLPNLFAGALETEILVCPMCHKLEFYAAEAEIEAEGESVPKKTCPTCGTVHDFDYPKCPKCEHTY